MKYDVIVVGAGPGGIFAAYELVKQNENLKIGVFEAGHALDKRKCPIDGEKIKTCISCKSCSIMSGFVLQYSVRTKCGKEVWKWRRRKKDFPIYASGFSVGLCGCSTRKQKLSVWKICRRNPV